MIFADQKNPSKKFGETGLHPDLPHMQDGYHANVTFYQRLLPLLRPVRFSFDEPVCLFLQANKWSFVGVKMSVKKRIRRYNSSMSRMRP
jgi:hypothetical protein